MGRSILVSALVAASLVALWSFTTRAQVIDSDPCG